LFPTPPPPNDFVRTEIDVWLPLSKGQLGGVAKCLLSGITERRGIVEAGAAANPGAVSNIIANIHAIRDGVIPRSPTRAAQARSAARSFVKQHPLTPDTLLHVEGVIDALSDVVDDPEAQELEEAQLKVRGDELETTLALGGGVYVFTFPHYWRHPTVEGTRRTLLKVGMTTRDAEGRVRQQARQTSVPEDPLLLRVYQHPTMDPRIAEKTFHRLLVAAEHTRGDTRTGGTEWFETSVDLLDTIAGVLGMTVHQADAD
jgi:hypothetical protein